MVEKGIIVKLQPPCSDCPLRCTQVISENQRQQILKYFYSLNDTNLRKLFVQKCVKKEEEVITEDDNDQTYNFYFTINGKRIHVCKTFFLSTLALPFSFVQKALELKFSDKTYVKKSVAKPVLKTPPPPPAKPVDPKLLEARREEGVRRHIKSIPRIVTCGKDSDGTSVYLEYSINVSTMYQLYTKYCKQKCIPQASMKRYKQVFEEMNDLFMKCRESLPLLSQNEVTIVTLKN